MHPFESLKTALKKFFRADKLKKHKRLFLISASLLLFISVLAAAVGIARRSSLLSPPVQAAETQAPLEKFGLFELTALAQGEGGVSPATGFQITFLK